MITAINGIPKVALAPLFLIMLGLGIWSKVAIASMTVFFVMFYNIYYGVKNLNTDLIHVLVLMGGSKLDVFRNVIMPGSMPGIIAGVAAALGAGAERAAGIKSSVAAFASANGLKGAIYGVIIVLFVLFEPLGLYGRWLKIKLFFQLFPLYKRATFKRQKIYVKSERNR